MRGEVVQDRAHALALAAARLRSALELLDWADAPPHIGAQVDLALHQLEQLDELAGALERPQIERKAEPQ